MNNCTSGINHSHHQPNLVSSIPPLPGLSVPDTLASSVLGGGVIYAGHQVANYLGATQVTPIYLSAYLGACIGLGMAYQSAKGIYWISCKMIGPRERYADPHFSPTSHLDKCRAHCWTLIVSLEGIPRRIDQLFCRTLNKWGVNLRPVEQIEREEIEDQHLFGLERIRKVAAMALKLMVIEQGIGQTVIAAITYMGAYALPPTTFFKFSLFVLAEFIAPLKALQISQKIDQQRQADEKMAEFMEHNNYNSETTTIDIRDYPSLTPTFLEKLIKNCPRLETLQLNWSDLSLIQGFDTQLDSSIEVELYPFASLYAPLYKDPTLRQLADEVYNEQPIHKAIINQFSCFNCEMIQNQKLKDLTQLEGQERKAVETLLKLAYQGKFPLYMLNLIYPQLAEIKSLVGRSEFADFTLTCQGEKTFPAHRALLVNSPYFKKRMKREGKDCSSENVDSENVDTVKHVITFIYEGVFRLNEIQDIRAVIGLCKKWELDKSNHLDMNNQFKKAAFSYLKDAKGSLEEVRALQKVVNEHFSDLIDLQQACTKRVEELEEKICIEEINRSKLSTEQVKKLFEQIKTTDKVELQQACLNYIKKNEPEDFKLFIKDSNGTKNIIHVHKIWLMHYSPYFAQFFTDHPDEEELDCKEFDFKTLRKGMEYLYYNDCNRYTSQEEYSALLKLAERWEIRDLLPILTKNSNSAKNLFNELPCQGLNEEGLRSLFL